MPGSFFILDRHSGFYARINVRSLDVRIMSTFFAIFFALRCLAADDFSILFLNRTGTRFDFGSGYC
jgi:hypothetical protein